MADCVLTLLYSGRFNPSKHMHKFRHCYATMDYAMYIKAHYIRLMGDRRLYAADYTRHTHFAMATVGCQGTAHEG